MIAELVIPAVLRMQLAASAAILIVLALRPATRAAFGAENAYRLWALPPICAVAGLFPTLGEFAADRSDAARAMETATTLAFSGGDRLATLLGAGWLAGAAGFLALLVWSEACFGRQMRRGRAGPAVVGMLWPRLITPDDYAKRFTPRERELIRLHEQQHIRRRDPHANAAIAAIQIVCWFNPLILLAARCARLDQELACDAAVVALHPADRRAYAETLVKTHLRAPTGLACAFAGGGRHPLETRIAMIARQRDTLRRYVAGCFVVGAIGLSMVASVLAAPSQRRLAPFHWSTPPAVTLVDLSGS